MKYRITITHEDGLRYELYGIYRSAFDALISTMDNITHTCKIKVEALAS